MVFLRTAVAEVPGAELEILSKSDADQRTYKADFSKMAHTFPSFQVQWSVEESTKQVHNWFTKFGLSKEDIKCPKYFWLKWLDYLIASRKLDGNFKWT